MSRSYSKTKVTKLDKDIADMLLANVSKFKSSTEMAAHYGINRRRLGMYFFIYNLTPSQVFENIQGRASSES